MEVVLGRVGRRRVKEVRERVRGREEADGAEERVEARRAQREFGGRARSSWRSICYAGRAGPSPTRATEQVNAEEGAREPSEVEASEREQEDGAEVRKCTV